MDSPNSASRAIAKMAVGLSLADIPAPVLARAKLHILDALGLGIAATVQDFAKSAWEGVSALGSGGDCSVIGRSERLALRDAALVNAVLIHGLDFDDTHLASIIHPTCTSLPAALALGEALDASGEALLTAFLAGAETSSALVCAVDGGFHHIGYHATGVVSHFAAAVTAGKLLGLDEDAITAAQGITGSTAAGIQVFLEEGAWTKRFHPGWGAVVGYHGGLSGAGAVQGAEPGLRRQVRPVRHPSARTGQAGSDDRWPGREVWHFGETALKPYPVCHFIHGCADAAIELFEEIGGADIASVTAFLPQPTLHIIAEPAEAKERAATEYEAKFSAQHVVAACLLRGRFALPDLLPGALADPAVRGLALRVKCLADPDSAFPEFFSGGIDVRLADGRVLTRHVRVNSGAGERAMGKDQVRAKFMASASLAIGEAQADAIAEAVLGLERTTARELARLLRQE